jgi:hypothetical protein
LKKLFQGGVEIAERPDGRFQIRSVPVLNMIGIEECIAYLTEQTGPEKPIDPFVATDGTAWVIVSQVLAQFGLRAQALQIAERYVTLCYKLQEVSNARFHKGAPLFWLSQRYLELGDRQKARSYMLLAFAEDIKFYDEPNRTSAYQQLVGILGVSPSMLESLTAFGRQIRENFPRYPEEVLIKWELYNMHTITEPIDIRAEKEDVSDQF